MPVCVNEHGSDYIANVEIAIGRARVEVCANYPMDNICNNYVSTKFGHEALKGTAAKGFEKQN